MEYVSGNIFIRANDAPMKRDEVILGHQHNFDHTTFVVAGKLEVSLIKPTSLNADGNPLDATVDKIAVIDAGDEINWLLIAKGRFHVLKALEDGTRYQCVYAHQMPQALSIETPGQLEDPPTSMRNEQGLWVRVNEKIVQVNNGWAEATR